MATTTPSIEQAIAQHQAGQLQAAGELYLAILQAQPNHPDANHNMGVLAVQMHQPAAGLTYFSAALDADPARGHYWLSYIDALLQAGQRDDARQILTMAQQQGLQGAAVEALAVRLEDSTPVSAPASAQKNGHKKLKNRPFKTDNPIPYSQGNPSAQEINSLVHLINAGRLTEAVSLAQVVTAHFPRHGFGWAALGVALKQLGRSQDALLPMQKAAALAPDDSNAHCNLGAVFQDLGRLEEAEASLQQALKINPDNAQAYCNLGVTLHALGRLDAAEANLQRALKLDPDNAQAHNNMGNVRKGLGRLSEAEASYRRTLQILPHFAEAHYNLGITLHELNRLNEAEASYRNALVINPDNAMTHNNLGVTLMGLDRLEQAEGSFLRALELQPDYVDAYTNLGATLMRRGSHENAETRYRQALKINPDHVLAHSNLGVTLQDLGRLDEAAASYHRALELNPKFVVALHNLLFVLNYHPDKSAEEIYKTYQEYDARFGQPYRSEWQPHHNSKDTQRRLKVGYVTPDFKKHSARYFSLPVMVHHSKQAVETYAYAELIYEDDVTAIYKKHMDHWVPTRGLSDQALAARIRADEIDILVDLTGHAGDGRLGVFARKPAPVTVTWLGCEYTTGLTAIDYILTDHCSAPLGSEHLFSETPWRMDRPHYVYQPAEGMGEVNALPALTTGSVTFGTLTRGIRINHRTIRVWSEILKRVRGARLVIDSRDYRTTYARDLLADKFAAHGIAPDRLQIGCNTPPWDVLRSLDIGLDCFPHNSGTTLFESLYMGVPYITLEGRPSLGRLGSMILAGVGHPELVAKTEDEYIEKGVALAGDLPRLTALRASLRQAMQSGPLMNGADFAGQMEAAYRGMFEKWARA